MKNFDHPLETKLVQPVEHDGKILTLKKGDWIIWLHMRDVQQLIDFLVEQDVLEVMRSSKPKDPL